MKKGAQVAAYVPSSDKWTWVLVKIEKKQGSNKYVVHDEIAENPQLERFVVETSKLSLFPNTKAQYEVGQHVLSQWKLDEKEWTTELYDAEIVKISKNSFNDKILTLKFPPGNDLLDVSVRNVTTYPTKFVPVDEEEEQKQEDEQQPEEEEKKEAPPPPPQQKQRANRSNKKSKSHSKQHTIENTTTSDDNQHHTTMNNTGSEESATSAHGETKDETSQASAAQMSTTTPPQSPPQEHETPRRNAAVVDEKPRTVKFIFNKVETADHTDFHLLTDDDFTHFLPEYKPPERIRITEGTPLLDALSDPELFDQINQHTTSSGSLFRNDLKPHEYKSALMEGKECGRIGKIFQIWKERR